MKPELRALALAAGLSLAAGAMPAFAGANDYVFEPIKVEVKNGPGSELAVRLVHKPTGKPVKDAVVIRTRLDMSPDNMEAMTAKHEALPSTEPGVYRFKANLTMEGGWAFKLMAKVQGEQETVTGTVIFKAKD
ncbi:MAG: FixH family protein [Hyphomicrobiaceae bacterium]